MQPHDIVKLIDQQWGMVLYPSQLRHWEKYGLLGEVKKTESGRRDYSQDNLERIKKVIVAKRLLNFPNYKVMLLLDGDEYVKEEVTNKLDRVEKELITKAKEVISGEETKKA